jgi:hypothetical protein
VLAFPRFAAYGERGLTILPFDEQTTMKRQDRAWRFDLLEARDRIGGWLCEAPLRHASKLELGGVAGRLSVAGEAEFHYGEIAGYWLSWAALYAPNSNLMTAVVNWLDRQWSGPHPAATRIGVRGDWRNQGVSSFDLAMIVRGLADAVLLVGEATCSKVAARIAGWLDRMVGADGRLDPWLVLDSVGFPDRWSTRRGPYQIKASVALLGAPTGWVPNRILRAAEETIDAWSARVDEQLEWHARLYAMEGLARVRPDQRAKIGFDHAVGYLPEQVGSSRSQSRADIQAQALRLLCLDPCASDTIRLQFADVVLAHVSLQGAVRFWPDDETANVWCAIFAHQALDWWTYRQGVGGIRKPDSRELI